MTTGMLPWLNNRFELDFLKRTTALLARSPSEEILIDRPKMIDFNDAPKLDNNSTVEASIKTGSLTTDELPNNPWNKERSKEHSHPMFAQTQIFETHIIL